MAADRELKRDIGFWGALTIGSGTMIGAGIFLLAESAIEAAGPSAFFSYLIAGVTCFLTAASAAELATGMASSGGDYFFVSRALGPAIGAISGVGIWLSLTTATAFYLIGAGDFLSELVAVPPTLTAVVGAAALLALNVIGAKETGNVQVVVVLSLVGILALLTLGGAFQMETDNLDPFFAGGTGIVFTTSALVFVSFLGFMQIAAVAEEVEDPGRNLPRALMGSVALVTTLYLLFVLVLSGAFTQDRFAEVSDPLRSLAGAAFGPVGATVVVVAGLLASISSANASILSSSRINLAMSRDGLFPQWLGQIGEGSTTPNRAIVLTASLAATFAVVLPNLQELAQIASALQLYSYGAVNIACVAMRIAAPDWYRPSFRVPFWPVTPLLGAIGCFGVIGFAGTAAQIAVGVLIVGGLAWYGWRSDVVDLPNAFPRLADQVRTHGLDVLTSRSTRHPEEL